MDSNSDDFKIVTKKCKLSKRPIFEYTSCSKYINDFLRQCDNIETEIINENNRITLKIIAGLDRIFDVSPCETLVLYRGLKKNLPHKYLGLNKAYISTDINLSGALYFSSDNGCVIEIHVDLNIPHIKVTNSPFIHEKEVILPRGLFLDLLTIKSIVNNNGVTIPVYVVQASYKEI